VTEGYAEFEFDLPAALLERLVSRFDEIEAAPLLPATVADVPEAQGVYQLWLKNELVYIGKTDAAKGLRHRLIRHATTIQHRQNLLPADVSFKAIRVFVFTAMDLEAQLIAHYGGVAWQHSGFGSNDPGRNRDGTKLKPGGYDELYPIDLDQTLAINLSEAHTVGAVFSALKSALPYLFRYQSLAKEIAEIPFTISQPQPTARNIIQAALTVLPASWQATDLHSRLILYRETKDYEHGVVVGRS